MRFWRIEINWLKPENNKIYIDDYKWPFEEEKPKKAKKPATKTKKTSKVK